MANPSVHAALLLMRVIIGVTMMVHGFYRPKG
jgi:hypothetical protein